MVLSDAGSTKQWDKKDEVEVDVEMGDEEMTTSTQYSSGHGSSTKVRGLGWVGLGGGEGAAARRLVGHDAAPRRVGPRWECRKGGAELLCLLSGLQFTYACIRTHTPQGESVGESGHAVTSGKAMQLLEWNIAEYTVKLKKGRTRTVLSNIAGQAQNGSFSAIMGPSGCTCLCALSVCVCVCVCVYVCVCVCVCVMKRQVHGSKSTRVNA